MSEYLYEFVGIVTKEAPTDGEIGKYMLSLRHHHRLHLPRILSFSVLAVSCGHLNYQKQLNPHTLALIYRRLLLEADFLFLLLTYCQLMPLLAWAQGRPLQQIQQALGAPFKEMIREIPSSQLKKATGIENVRKCLDEHLRLLRLLDCKNFFEFFFHLINGANDSLENDIDCFFMEMASTDFQEGFFSSSELAILQKNIELQYGKLRKRKYQEEAIQTVYRWLEGELQGMLSEGEENTIHLSMELFAQVVRTQSNICGTTLLQVLDAVVESLQPQKARYFFQLIDTCILEGSYKLSTQAILFLASTIFSKIHSKKLRVGGDIVVQHFLLWREVASKRQLPIGLLSCLIEWLPFLYDQALTTHTNPEILQLYRRELLKLREAAQESGISGLRMLVEELEYRKIEGIYAQLQEFHSQMDKSHHSHPKHLSFSKANYHFNTSQVSNSNSEFNSLLNGFDNSYQMHEKSKSEHLQLLSKPHSKNGSFAIKEEPSFRECVEIIISLIDLFDYHLTPSLTPLNNTNKSSTSGSKLPPKSKLLPLMSAHSMEKQEGGQFQCVKNIIITTIGLSQEFKKKMVKRRGLVVKKESIEIGYMINPKQSKISLFLTFLKPTISCTLNIKENSFKLKGEKQWHFSQPKTNHQYHISYNVTNVKLYSLQGVPNSERIVRSRLQISMVQGRNKEDESCELPITIFNLIDLIRTTPQDLPQFSKEPSLETKWYPICSKLATQGSGYLQKFLPFSRDPKGNYLLKCQLLEDQMLARVLLVLGEAKVQVLSTAKGNRELLLAMGLMQVMG